MLQAPQGKFVPHGTGSALRSLFQSYLEINPSQEKMPVLHIRSLFFLLQSALFAIVELPESFPSFRRFRHVKTEDAGRDIFLALLQTSPQSASCQDWAPSLQHLFQHKTAEISFAVHVLF